ncbi:hypothetical protein [Metabacillus sediminilitoris]|uniref:Uncharacterized protein n=1 Tax=Metabacillus sediminilitoris TaxID=2567941 RepID=A0A4S4BWV6_9BACI|nr:hypothetical protein [Metabacillus sediminilitoris]QGQ45992.1 hypothetical protein GMB29_12590 [Metabacillus sediminilitoris]THF79676.1 hypothetical protein E6W99_11710 [Metabacillus sediminilitoris]
MNAKVKKTIFWGTIITPMVLGAYFLLGSYSALAAGPHGHGGGGMVPRGGFGGGHHIMNSPHNGGGFSWLGFLLFLIAGIVILVLLVKWLRRKAKASSMQQFVDTSMMNSHKPIMTKNEGLLDQWEKNITNKKETI